MRQPWALLRNAVGVKNKYSPSTFLDVLVSPKLTYNRDHALPKPLRLRKSLCCEKIKMPSPPTMLLGVLSDTHGHIANTQAAVRMLESLQVDTVLHCGDIGSASIPSLLENWPTHYVFGNVDYNETELRDAILKSGHQCHHRFGEIELAGKKIALLHSHDAKLFEKTIRSGRFDLVCYGHTHQAEQHLEGQTLVLNPGAVYRATPHSLAVVELPALRATIVPF
jgi:putative phosphoesterase